MTPEERTEWVLWSVRNDPEIEAPSGQEKVAANCIHAAILAAELDARKTALEEAARECLKARQEYGVGLDAAYFAQRIRGLVTDALKAPADSMSVHDPSTDDRIE